MPAKQGLRELLSREEMLDGWFSQMNGSIWNLNYAQETKEPLVALLDTLGASVLELNELAHHRHTL